MSHSHDGVNIEIYKGEQLELYTRLPLHRVVAISLMKRTGRRVDASAYRIFAINIADPVELEGTPRLVNVRGEFGHVILASRKADGSTQQEMVPIRELLGPTVREIVVGLDPAETYWGYCLAAPVMDAFPIAKPTPTVEGTIDFFTDEPVQTRFRVRRGAEPELPEFDASQLGEAGAALTGTGVILSAGAHDLLARDLPLSDLMEVGGFLSGTSFRAAGRENVYIVLVEGVLPAQHAGASGGQFTFTPDSFRHMNDRLEALPGQRLLGWYHTHLFAATTAMGLSELDLDLHFRTFQQPWHVAGLINYSQGRRVRRFYVRDGMTMQECPQWIFDERGGYRPAGAALGT